MKDTGLTLTSKQKFTCCGVKGSRLGRSRVAVLSRGDTGDPLGGLQLFFRGDRCGL